MSIYTKRDISYIYPWTSWDGTCAPTSYWTSISALSLSTECPTSGLLLRNSDLAAFLRGYVLSSQAGGGVLGTALPASNQARITSFSSSGSNRTPGISELYDGRRGSFLSSLTNVAHCVYEAAGMQRLVFRFHRCDRLMCKTVSLHWTELQPVRRMAIAVHRAEDRQPACYCLGNENRATLTVKPGHIGRVRHRQTATSDSTKNARPYIDGPKNTGSALAYVRASLPDFAGVMIKLGRQKPHLQNLDACKGRRKLRVRRSHVPTPLRSEASSGRRPEGTRRDTLRACDGAKSTLEGVASLETA
ncbi:hypothetical protein BKA93DRAFT_748577 [Sparassis latifolia]